MGLCHPSAHLDVAIPTRVAGPHPFPATSHPIGKDSCDEGRRDSRRAPDTWLVLAIRLAPTDAGMIGTNGTGLPRISVITQRIQEFSPDWSRLSR